MDSNNAGGLVLKDVRLADSGLYKCVIRSAGGNVSFKSNLKVIPFAGEDCCTPQKGSSFREPTTTSDCGASAASSTVLVGVIAFVTALAVTGIFVFIGRWWNERNGDDLTQNVATAEMRKNGTVVHRMKKQKANGDTRAVVLGGQGVYSKAPDDLCKGPQHAVS